VSGCRSTGPGFQARHLVFLKETVRWCRYTTARDAGAACGLTSFHKKLSSVFTLA
jgi:hypothetical protein